MGKVITHTDINELFAIIDNHLEEKLDKYSLNDLIYYKNIIDNFTELCKISKFDTTRFEDKSNKLKGYIEEDKLKLIKNKDLAKFMKNLGSELRLIKYKDKNEFEFELDSAYDNYKIICNESKILKIMHKETLYNHTTKYSSGDYEDTQKNLNILIDLYTDHNIGFKYSAELEGFYIWTDDTIYYNKIPKHPLYCFDNKDKKVKEIKVYTEKDINNRDNINKAIYNELKEKNIIPDLTKYHKVIKESKEKDIPIPIGTVFIETCKHKWVILSTLQDAENSKSISKKLPYYWCMCVDSVMKGMVGSINSFRHFDLLTNDSIEIL